jgi:hypothetical protein
MVPTLLPLPPPVAADTTDVDVGSGSGVTDAALEAEAGVFVQGGLLETCVTVASETPLPLFISSSSSPFTMPAEAFTMAIAIR